MLTLTAGDYRLLLDPERGGSIAAFTWRDLQLMRPTCGRSIFDTACFPLVPFSNRIAYGRFAVDGLSVTMAPNMPGSAHPHTLHGFGWLSSWKVVDQGGCGATLEHVYSGREWPWHYRARQTFALDQHGLRIRLSLVNLSERTMPAGLGLHPYFPRDPDTVYHGLHCGEWRNGPDGLPITLIEADDARDWWAGAPIGTRVVDTVYTGRHGVLTIDWPSRRSRLTTVPSASLSFTVVYVPDKQDFFCIEPVSHATDAINRARTGNGLVWLDPGVEMASSVAFSATSLTRA